MKKYKKKLTLIHHLIVKDRKIIKVAPYFGSM